MAEHLWQFSCFYRPFTYKKKMVSSHFANSRCLIFVVSTVESSVLNTNSCP